jgi:Flagellar hook-length control protein FliK
MLSTRPIGNSRPLDAPGRNGRAGESGAATGDDAFQAALGAAAATQAEAAAPGRQQGPVGERAAGQCAAGGRRSAPLPREIGGSADGATAGTIPASAVDPGTGAPPLPQQGGEADDAGVLHADGSAAPAATPTTRSQDDVAAGQVQPGAADHLAPAPQSPTPARVGAGKPHPAAPVAAGADPALLAAATVVAAAAPAPAVARTPTDAAAATPAVVAAGATAQRGNAAQAAAGTAAGQPLAAGGGAIPGQLPVAGKADRAAAVPSSVDPHPSAARMSVAAIALAAAPGAPSASRSAPDGGARHGGADLAGAGATAPVVMTGSDASTAAAAGSPSASSTPGSGPHGVTDQLSQPMIQLVTSGGHEIVLHLNPPNLGDVSVRVLVSGRDVSAWFDAAQQPVQQAIAQGMGQLQADLAGAGYNLNGAWVGGDAWTPRERAGGGAAPRQPREPAPGAPIAEPSGVAATPTGTGVSVYV